MNAPPLFARRFVADGRPGNNVHHVGGGVRRIGGFQKNYTDLRLTFRGASEVTGFFMGFRLSKRATERTRCDTSFALF